MSKTFKALQRAAEERAAKREAPPIEETDEPEILDPESAEPTVDLSKERQELQTLKDEATKALERSELLRREAESEARRSAEEARVTLAEKEKAAELSRAAERSEEIAREKEAAAREMSLEAERLAKAQERARQEAERERANQERAKAAAERELEALESIKEAMAQERSAQDTAREAIQKERAALESLREALETDRLHAPLEASKERRISDPEEMDTAEAEQCIESEDFVADPLADLPPLDDRKPDPALQKLLSSELVRSSDPRPAKVGPTGRVLGSLDPQRAAVLLKRYALLHCLREGPEVTLWFWGNGKEARDYAASRSLPLDEEALS